MQNRTDSFKIYLILEKEHTALDGQDHILFKKCIDFFFVNLSKVWKYDQCLGGMVRWG